MLRPKHYRHLSFSALLLCAMIAPARSQTTLDVSPPLALVGGAVYASAVEPPIRDGVVLVDGGKITAVGERSTVKVPPGAKILDCLGLTILPGFWNSHVHFMQRKWQDAAKIPAEELTAQLQAMLTRYGFTSVFDTGSPWENTRDLRDRIESGEVRGPRIRSAGEIIFPKGGAMLSGRLADAFGMMRAPMPEVSEPGEAVEIVTRQIDGGVDAIKIYAATWVQPIVVIPPKTFQAIAAEAHRRGKLVLAHPSNRDGLLAAIEGGADIIVHTAPNSGEWDENLLALMKQKHVALIPTLKLWKYETRHDRASLVRGFINSAIRQLRVYQESGGAILFGTDVGYIDDYGPGDEYAMMSEAGMDFRQILASLTTAPAERFGDSAKLGRIAPGMLADIAVLEEDPASAVRAFAKIRYTLRDGKIIYQASGWP